jgi:dTDP-4-amino-4,6-dideoxygalactose transaminase
VDPARSPLNRRQLFDGLRTAGIGVNVHYIPVHTQPHYRRLGFAPGQFPAAEAYYAQAISLPMFPTLTDDQQGTVIAALHQPARLTERPPRCAWPSSPPAAAASASRARTSGPSAAGR